MNKIMIVIGITSVGFLTACSRPADQQSEPPAASAEVTIFTDTAPVGDPTPIPEARKQFKPGDEVMLEGLVMGASSFVDNRAIVIIGDQKMPTACSATSADGCATDTDCAPVDRSQVATAAIQVVDENGDVLHVGLKGQNGLTEMSQIKVAGIVAPMSTPEGFIVNASSLYVIQ